MTPMPLAMLPANMLTFPFTAIATSAQPATSVRSVTTPAEQTGIMHARPFGTQSSVCVTNHVNGGVLTRAKNRKVFETIIRLVSVDVVNYLITSQWATKFPLHNNAMFQPLLPINPHRDIPISAESTTASPIRRLLSSQFAACDVVTCTATETRRSKYRCDNEQHIARLTASFNVTSCVRRLPAIATTEFTATALNCFRGNGEMSAALHTGTLYWHGSHNLSCQPGALRVSPGFIVSRIPRPQANFTTGGAL